VFREPGRFSFKGITVRGTGLYHDPSRGSERGGNVAFTYLMDGITLCHLGDLGHVLDSREAKEIGPVDVLMIPVGGTFTVNAEEAWMVVKMLSPKICLPMHYKTKGVAFNLDPLEGFTSGREGTKVLGVSETEIGRAGLPGQTEVWILKPSKL
jgi:L-ascorbate metabolism protein UlaG (beta-lactamase superfamily)